MPRRNNKRWPGGPKAAGMRHVAAQNTAGDFATSAARNFATPYGQPYNASPQDFSMRDTARNTAQHHQSISRRDVNLRARPVVFVSAGMMDPLEELESQENPENGQVVRAHESSDDRGSGNAQPPVHVEGPYPGPRQEGSSSLLSLDPSGGVDPENPSPLPSPVPAEGHHQVADTLSLVAEDSDSSEVILFKGRANFAKSKKTEPAPTRDEINIRVTSTAESIHTPPVAPNASPGRRRFSARMVEDEPSDESAAVVADYIANMAEDSDEDLPHYSFLNNRDLGGDDVVLGDGKDESSDKEDASDAAGLMNSDGSPEMDQDIGDEALARLLSKQEEFGIGGDDLVISDMHTATKHVAETSRRAAVLARGGGSRIPSASSVADAFDDLDLMDWGRPSLQNAAKGRRKKPAFNVGDPDLEAALQSAWDKDRQRKKERKLEREELRSQGMLGKHADPDDPRVKYSVGMTLENVREELRGFLISGEETLKFPPMDKSARRMLHEMGNKLKLKTRSVGKNDQRRPILQRTKATPSYVEDEFEEATARVGRKYFGRPDTWDKTARRGGGGGGGRGRHAAVSYRDGEVVGASAPELGQENRGRAMLEKMGWTSGTALGAMDNKGILLPVAHVVKRTKAGLGQA